MGESSERQGARFSFGIKNVMCDSLECSPGKGEISDSMGRQFLKGLSVTAVPVNPGLGVSDFKLFEKLLLVLNFSLNAPGKCVWSVGKAQ